MAQEIIHLPSNMEGLKLRALLQQHDFICLVSNETNRFDAIAENILFFNNDVKVLKLPAWDSLPYDRISPSQMVMSQRLATFAKLQNLTGKTVLLLDVRALTQRTIASDILQKFVFEIKAGENLSRELLQGAIHEAGFVRLINAVHPGEYAARGGIIDIVLDDSGKGFRIDFFGDHIESIRLFDTDTQVGGEKINSVTIVPSNEVMLGHTAMENFKENYRSLFGVTNDPLFDSISVGRRYAGMENWLPLFYDHLGIVIDYCPTKTLFLLPQTLPGEITAYQANIFEQYEARNKVTSQKDKTATPYYPLPPEQLYLSETQLADIITPLNHCHYSPFADEAADIKLLPNLRAEAAANNQSPFELLKTKLGLTENKISALCCFTKGSRDRLAGILHDHSITFSIHDGFDSLASIAKGALGLTILPLEYGYSFNNFVLYSEKDLLGERFVRKPKSKKLKQQIFSELNTLAEGELVVHAEHGIGRFEGLETLKVANSVHDFVKLTYAGNDKLYLPVENLELLTRYGGEDATLDKLGGAAWQSRKSKLKSRIKLAAESLLKVAAARQLNHTEPVTVIHDLYEEFCNRFPYVETEDQLSAIEDVSHDLQLDRPMDRLICGDVGFGKTEVALRAAFQAVACTHPSQVAILVPTTLLARQHFRTFSERFAGFPIKIRQLSRFVPNKEIKHIKEEITQGSVDIVIGTHALLAKDIKFANLGLIVIDEEQHFGVAQKEKLRELRANCHALTLSATPIPRTLQMSLTGIRELSLVATPPLDRFPIRTTVVPYDTLTIREAIMREFYRGGRIFYVTPRIAYIDGIIEILRELVPEVKAVSAHGQLTALQLDKIMNDFYDGKFQILVSTSIVESGLDIPMANTIIVDRAHMFGLAQLYQIRGRVGRSNTQAYAYLTYPSGMKLNPVAEKRLTILQSLDSLGAGFSIASHDMDIRGYGNLVGEEQSGHIKEVGLELYQQMLEDAIHALKDSGEVQQVANWSPILNIGLSIQIPENYIPDISLRLSLYRRIAALSTEVEVESFAAEMIDRFGALPEEAEYLLAVVKLKGLAKIANIEKVELGDKALILTFKNNIPANGEKVINLLNTSLGQAKLRPDARLLITCTWKTAAEIITGLQKILLSLA